jgi:hypothetical protein
LKPENDKRSGKLSIQKSCRLKNQLNSKTANDKLPNPKFTIIMFSQDEKITRWRRCKKSRLFLARRPEFRRN